MEEKKIREISLKIERRIISSIRKDINLSPITKSMLEYSLKGGKMIRGVLGYLSMKLLGESENSSINFGAFLELVQAFTLVHDDIMDRPKKRRGKKPLFQKFGVNKAILVGDMLLAYSLKFLQIEKIKIENLIKVIDGQILDEEWKNIKKKREKIKKVFEIQKKKTASLFSLSMPGLQKIGEKFGILFQIIDDMKDIKEDIKSSSPNIVLALGEKTAKKIYEKYKKEIENEIEREIQKWKSSKKYKIIKLIKYIIEKYGELSK